MRELIEAAILVVGLYQYFYMRWQIDRLKGEVMIQYNDAYAAGCVAGREYQFESTPEDRAEDAAELRAKGLPVPSYLQ